MIIAAGLSNFSPLALDIRPEESTSYSLPACISLSHSLGFSWAEAGVPLEFTRLQEDADMGQPERQAAVVKNTYYMPEMC